MSQYLLATYSVEDAAPGTPPSPEEMKAFMKRVMDLEEEMDAAGAFLFGGALHGADAATVIDATGDDVITTDGPFTEAKEHIAGFYVIEAADLDDALEWAAKVTAAINHSIEVRPFRATGKVADHQPA
jgi:hypothetical protein